MARKRVLQTAVLLVGEQLPALVDIALQFDPASYATVVVQSARPLEHLLQPHSTEPAGVILALTGGENVADLQALLNAYPQTTFVFLAPAFPPRAAVARVVAEHGASILRASESPLTIVATMVMQMYQRQG
jgi:hypothetical protein